MHRSQFIHGRTATVFLDNFFLVFHTLFTLFNMIGWVWRRTRRIHLVTVLVTAFSWFVMGFWYGWGYCFCTDWHWKVRDALGRPITSESYIHFLIMELTGLDLPQKMVDTATLWIFLACAAASLALNGRDLWRRRRAKDARSPRGDSGGR